MRAALLLLTALVGLLAVSVEPSFAQATRTWVSGVGDDANPCSRTAPCKTFSGAISKTAVAGEINVIDPGGFGPVTITKSITIRSDHIEAGVLVTGTNGIVIAAGAGDTIILEGLDIDGSNTGLNGVSITAGKLVYLIHCAIRHFTQNGVNMASNSAGARLFIQDSLINLNGDATHGGVNVQGNGTGNAVSIIHSTIDSNPAFALQATGAGNVFGVANSTLTGSATSLSLVGGANAVSFGPSNVTSPPAAFPTTNTFK